MGWQVGSVHHRESRILADGPASKVASYHLRQKDNLKNLSLQLNDLVWR